MSVDFDGRIVTYDFAELDEVMPAYAMSIHKSQGSEFPAIVIPVHTQHYMMLQRNLLYTGITRGKRLVVLVGVPKRGPRSCVGPTIFPRPIQSGQTEAAALQGLVTEAVNFSFQTPFGHQTPIWTHFELVSEVLGSS